MDDLVIPAKERPVYVKRLLVLQDYKCAICRRTFPPMIRKGKRIKKFDACLDHNHKTGVIRELLCRRCNRGEGKIIAGARMNKGTDSSLEFLTKVQAYLQKHEGKDGYKLKTKRTRKKYKK